MTICACFVELNPGEDRVGVSSRTPKSAAFAYDLEVPLANIGLNSHDHCRKGSCLALAQIR